jgi:hypothetical protein
MIDIGDLYIRYGLGRSHDLVALGHSNTSGTPIVFNIQQQFLYNALICLCFN